MSAGILGFIIGLLLGGLFGCIALSVVITAGRADERDAKLFEEYMKRKKEEENDHNNKGNNDNN